MNKGMFIMILIDGLEACLMRSTYLSSINGNAKSAELFAQTQARKRRSRAIPSAIKRLEHKHAADIANIKAFKNSLKPQFDRHVNRSANSRTKEDKQDVWTKRAILVGYLM